jgi:type III pantothenate kinase
MLNLINIGNTNYSYCSFDGENLSDISTAKTASLSEINVSAESPVAVVSVVPESNNFFTEFNDIFWLNCKKKSNLDISLIDTSTFGADRLANAIALGALEELPAICIDFGTAITFEIVDQNRALRGGAILPGRELLRNSLSDNTSQLPYIELSGTVPYSIGTNTANAIRLGIDGGIIGTVKEIIKIIEIEVGSKCSKVATGGDSDFFKSSFPEIKFEGNIYTFKGLLKAWELNK